MPLSTKPYASPGSNRIFPVKMATPHTDLRSRNSKWRKLKACLSSGTVFLLESYDRSHLHETKHEKWPQIAAPSVGILWHASKPPTMRTLRGPSCENRVFRKRIRLHFLKVMRVITWLKKTELNARVIGADNDWGTTPGKEELWFIYKKSLSSRELEEIK